MASNLGIRTAIVTLGRQIFRRVKKTDGSVVVEPGEIPLQKIYFGSPENDRMKLDDFNRVFPDYEYPGIFSSGDSAKLEFLQTLEKSSSGNSKDVFKFLEGLVSNKKTVATLNDLYNSLDKAVAAQKFNQQFIGGTRLFDDARYYQKGPVEKIYSYQKTIEGKAKQFGMSFEDLAKTISDKTITERNKSAFVANKSINDNVFADVIQELEDSETLEEFLKAVVIGA